MTVVLESKSSVGFAVPQVFVVSALAWVESAAVRVRVPGRFSGIHVRWGDGPGVHPPFYGSGWERCEVSGPALTVAATDRALTPDLGHAESRIFVGESEKIRIMARRNFTDEFRRQAVDLYESTPGATVRGIAADLGVERGTLRHWLDLFGTGKKTAADGSPTVSPLKPTAGANPLAGVAPADESPEQRIARLEAENAALRAETAKLTTEREILRSAAKYFAGETNW